MSISLNTVVLLYLVASVCFIQALKGLSHPSSSRAGNTFGMVGMTIAVITTVALVFKIRPEDAGSGLAWVLGGVVVGVVLGGVVVGVVDGGAGVTAKYTAIPAMTRTTTMITTVAVVLMALRLMIFILAFMKPLRDYKRVGSTLEGQDSLFNLPHWGCYRNPVCPLLVRFIGGVPDRLGNRCGL